jgi:amino acid adenylation domain-containing protein
VKADDIADIYELTPLQQGLLFHTLCEPRSGVYFCQLRVHLHGKLDADAFRQAWQTVVDHHPVLRTSFVWEEVDKPLQVVHRHAKLSFEELDWRNLTAQQQGVQMDMWLKVDRRRGVKLDCPPLMRVALFRASEDDWWFVWSHHHLVIDGWSRPLVLKDALVLYEGLRQGQRIPLPETWPFRDYVTWLQEQDPEEARRFWREKLAGLASPTRLGIDRLALGGAKLRPVFRECARRLSAQLTRSLEAVARENQLTLNTVMQGAWALLLGRYSGESEVVFGATVSGRQAPLTGIETMVGMFINTLPVRVALPRNERVLAWLKSLHAQLVELRRYEHSPLEEVRQCGDVPPGTPLFESLYVLENYPLDSSLVENRCRGLQIREVHDDEQTNYPLSLIVLPGDEISLRVVYDQSRFDDAPVERLLGHLETLLRQLVGDLQQRLSHVSCLSDRERHHVLVEWNGPNQQHQTDCCLHQLFQEQVQRTPDHVALIFNESTLTYRQLDERSNQLARHLQALGVGPEVLVGICTERCPEMVIAMLGVLGAGGAYVPLDPYYPPARLASMLEDTQAAVLLTKESLVERLPDRAARVFCLDRDWQRIAREDKSPTTSDVASDNLAYVMYTSGSTGRPKGVAVEHHSVCHICRVIADRFGVDANGRVLQFSSSSFDASVVEIFPALITGAAVVLARAEQLLPGPGLIRLLEKHRVTVAILPPSALSVMPSACLPELHTLVAAGERCTAEIVQRWAVGRRFINGYGPTEGTVCASLYECQPSEVRPPIGRPLTNVQAFVLGPDMQPVPVGVPGELYIGGAGLARGYLNRPELTAERFVVNPFSRHPRSRLYRTGDRCRWLPDGNLDFLGRVDHQVKVHGFRIELGEIESVLSEHPDVRQAVVAAKNDAAGDARLVGYVVPRGGAKPTVGQLRAFLEEKLPRFMLPNALATLDRLPLSPNGKVDRGALPAPESARPNSQKLYVPPRTREERILADIWAQVLGLERVGIHDDFFELGGGSIKSLRIVGKAAEAGLAPTSASLTPELLFQYTTIAELAAALGHAEH